MSYRVRVIVPEVRLPNRRTEEQERLAERFISLSEVKIRETSIEKLKYRISYMTGTALLSSAKDLSREERHQREMDYLKWVGEERNKRLKSKKTGEDIGERVLPGMCTGYVRWSDKLEILKEKGRVEVELSSLYDSRQGFTRCIKGSVIVIEKTK